MVRISFVWFISNVVDFLRHEAMKKKNAVGMHLDSLSFHLPSFQDQDHVTTPSEVFGNQGTFDGRP